MNAAISVIIPSLNMGRFLDAGLRSILRQDPQVTEVIVVDPGSEDETFAVLSQWRERGLPIRLIRDEGRGPGPARNLGIEAASGNIIGFLDADDTWPAGKTARQLARLAGVPHVDMVSGYVRYFDLADAAGVDPAEDARTECLFHVHLGCCLYRRAALERVGLFDPDFLYSEDVDLLLRVRESGLPFTILRSVELNYRRHGDSMMTQDNPRKRSDFHRAVLKSLGRRRAAGLPPINLRSFASYLEPLQP